MGDQQLFKSNHTTNNNEILYYRQQQSDALTAVGGNLNHNYETSGMDASQSSPGSPHFPQDFRDNSTLTLGLKSLASVESSRQTSWPQSGSDNHIGLRNNINSQTNQNVLWNSPGQSESDGYHYTYSPQAKETRSQKIASGVLHKLDSFTQVFSNQNLRIQANSMAHDLHSHSSLMDNTSDSALRQLLSQKHTIEHPSVHSDVQSYQQVPQHINQSFTSTQQKQQMEAEHHQQQQHVYYNYPQPVSQMQPQSALQQGQHQLQQVQTQQMLPQQMQEMLQAPYYIPSHPTGQQCASMQEMQQQVRHQPQRQCPVQISQCYQTHTVMQQFQHIVQLHQQQQQQQHMQLQPSAYHRDPNQRTAHETHPYSQEQVNPAQLIQLGTAPQYFYQNPQQLRNYYQQSLLQQQQQQEVTQKKQYHSDIGSKVLMGPHANLTNAELMEENTRQHYITVGNQPPPPQPVTPLPNNRGTQQCSPNAMWPQISRPESRLPTISPEQSVQHKGPLPDRADVKSRLTCSTCFKEFKSLPALNGHMRSHGGIRASPIFKQDEREKQQLKEVGGLTPIIMPVSVPVKLFPPEPSMQVNNTLVKDKPANPVSDDEMPVLMRMTCSPHCPPTAPSSYASSETIRRHHQNCAKSENSEENHKPHQEKKKYRHRPEPLFIPPPSFSFSMSHSGATLYQSQLRSPRIIGDHLLVRTQELPPYTPPPMLSPVRQGSGLFSSVITAHGSAVYSQLPLTPLTPTPRILLFRSSLDGGSFPLTPGPGEQNIDIEPRINIGSRFQANIPELLNPSSLEKELHKATLVWKPLPVLENKECLQRVMDFLNMSCSSVLPGGGTNLEYALHSLFEANGDVLRALEMLLLKKKFRSRRHPLANYHYAGSDKWTSQERKLFNKALANNNKDLFHVQKMVNSKTLAQCVEYYYTLKKIMRFGRRHRTRLAELAVDIVTSAEEDVEDAGGDDDDDEEEELEDDNKSENEVARVIEECEMQTSQPVTPVTAHLELMPVESLVLPSVCFICEMPNCGAVFNSRQALNGHARIHGGTNQVPKTCSVVSAVKHKTVTQSGYYSVKSSPAHSTTSGEMDPTTDFPCKECGKVFFKIKSRNAHMKTHRQQEERQRQKAQKAAVAAEIAATIARTAVPMGHGLIAPDHLSLINHMEFEDDVAQNLGDVMDEVEVMAADFLLDDDADFLQDDNEL